MTLEVELLLKTVRELVSELPTFAHDKFVERCRVTIGCACFCGKHVPYPELHPVNSSDLEKYEKAMAEAIPEIVQYHRERQALAAEARTRTM